MAELEKEMVNEIQETKGAENSNRYLIVVDMQKDFVTGSLGSKEAELIVESVTKKVQEYKGNIIFTMDTHEENYMTTQEGKLLPVAHCIHGTQGWQLIDEMLQAHKSRGGSIYHKPTFGCVKLAEDLKKINEKTPIEEIELVGLCTDVCVVSNALLVKAYMPEVPVYVDRTCCAGITPQKHEAALQTMESCHIMIK